MRTSTDKFRPSLRVISDIDYNALTESRDRKMKDILCRNVSLVYNLILPSLGCIWDMLQCVGANCFSYPLVVSTLVFQVVI